MSTYIAKNSSKVMVGSRNNKSNNIEVENDCTQPNNIVEIWTRQTNQSRNMCIINIILAIAIK